MLFCSKGSTKERVYWWTVGSSIFVILVAHIDFPRNFPLCTVQFDRKRVLRGKKAKPHFLLSELSRRNKKKTAKVLNLIL